MASKLGSNALARKWRSGFRLGCLSGIALTLLMMAGLGMAVRRQPDRFPGPVRAFYGVTGPLASGVGSGLSLEQIQAIRGVRPTVQVTLTEDDINSYLEEHPEAIGLPGGFAAPQVRFSDEQVHMSARTRVLFFAVRVWLSMEPRVEAGELKLSVKKVEAGDVELPGELRKIAEREVAKLLSQRLAEAGLVPESAEVGEGTFTVAARLVPVEGPPGDQQPAAARQPSRDEPPEDGPEPGEDASAQPGEAQTAPAAPDSRPWWPGGRSGGRG